MRGGPEAKGRGEEEIKKGSYHTKCYVKVAFTHICCLCLRCIK